MSTPLYTSDDIANARDDLRGECTCTFVPVTDQPGIYTRPVTDRHCPVHVACPEPELHRLHDEYLNESCPYCEFIRLELGTDGVWAVKP